MSLRQSNVFQSCMNINQDKWGLEIPPPSYSDSGQGSDITPSFFNPTRVKLASS